MCLEGMKKTMENLSQDNKCPSLVSPSHYTLHFMPASVEWLTLSQVRITVITETTGNCTFEASPLLQINNTTSTVHKLFIRLAAKCYKFLRK
jgi:hypothetical protein